MHFDNFILGLSDKTIPVSIKELVHMDSIDDLFHNARDSKESIRLFFCACE